MSATRWQRQKIKLGTTSPYCLLSWLFTLLISVRLVFLDYGSSRWPGSTIDYKRDYRRAAILNTNHNERHSLTTAENKTKHSIAPLFTELAVHPVHLGEAGFSRSFCSHRGRMRVKMKFAPFFHAVFTSPLAGGGETRTPARRSDATQTIQSFLQTECRDSYGAIAIDWIELK